MSDHVTNNPFIGEPVEEIRLSSAPLILVICQMRWPQVTAMAGDISDIASQYGKAVEHNFPLSNQHKEVQFQLSPQGVTQTQGDDIYEWTSADGDWSILVSQRYFTLQTKKYTNRQDFFERMSDALGPLLSIVDIPVLERIGFRYTNRISDAGDLARLSDLVRAPALGSFEFGDDVEMVHTLSEAVYRVGEANLRVRSAQLPRGGTIDPAITPIDDKSWILDLDASSEARTLYNVPDSISKAQELSILAYGYFRWAVKPEFLTHFGGTS